MSRFTKVSLLPVFLCLAACAAEKANVTPDKADADDELLPDLPVYNVQARHSSACLDVTNNSQAVDTPIQQWSCGGVDNQRWRVQRLPDGSYRLLGFHSGLTLSVENGSNSDGAHVVQAKWRGGAYQKWRVNVNAAGFTEWVNLQSNKCLDITGGNKANGALLQQWGCWQPEQQQFRMVGEGLTFGGGMAAPTIGGNYAGINVALGGQVQTNGSNGSDPQLAADGDPATIYWPRSSSRINLLPRGGAQYVSGFAVTYAVYNVNPMVRVSSDATSTGTGPVIDAGTPTFNNNTPYLRMQTHYYPVGANVKRLTIEWDRSDGFGIAEARIYAPNAAPSKLLLGADTSGEIGMEQGNRLYTDGSHTGPARDVLRANGMNIVRQHVFNDPPGGVQGLGQVAYSGAMAHRAGMKFLIDFQYEDVFQGNSPTDAHKGLPLAWVGQNDDQLFNSIYTFTYHALDYLVSQGAEPEYIEIGNEAGNNVFGIYEWWSNPQQAGRLARMLHAGFKAAHDRLPRSRTLLHQGSVTGPQFGDDLHNNLYYHLTHNGVYNLPSDDFDIFASSYYPTFKHGSITQHFSTLRDIAVELNKDVLVVECQYDNNAFPPWQNNGNWYWDLSGTGQLTFMRDVASALYTIPGGHGLGALYFAPNARNGGGLFWWVGNPSPAFVSVKGFQMR